MTMYRTLANPASHPETYRPDGGYTLGAVVILALIGLASAVTLGTLQGFLMTKGFSIFLVSALIIGLAHGYLLSWSVKLCKIRSPFLCAYLASLSGIFACLCFLFYGYQHFEWKLADVPSQARVLARDFEKHKAATDAQPAEMRQMLDKLKQDGSLRETLAVDGFFSYMDMMARRGVKMVDLKARNREPTNLGYTGSYLYWGFEAILIAAIACGLAISQAKAPFCEACDCWKTPFVTGSLICDPKNARAALEAGDLSAFDPSRPIEPGDQVLHAALWKCSECEKADWIEVRLHTISLHSEWSGKGTVKPLKHICTVSYPGSAASALTVLIQALRVQEAVESAIKENVAQLGQQLNILSWVVLFFAFLVIAGSSIFWFVEGALPLPGFGVGAVLVLCGWGLRWVAERESTRH